MSTSSIELCVPKAERVMVTKDTLSVDLSDGRTISVPLSWFPRLVHATVAERSNWRLIGKGHGVHWPDIDEDISIEGLLAGRASGESQSSFQKWLDQRSYRLTNRQTKKHKRNLEHRQELIKIRVARDDVPKILRKVGHGKYLDALESHWKVFEDGQPQAQSICWLFCWAKTGNNSKIAEQEAKNVFNRLFDKPFEWFDKRVPHNWAREARYRQGNIESELEHFLKKTG
jgi:hypothetical protein